MSKSRAYRTIDVKNVSLAPLLQVRENQAVVVGLDVSKQTVFVVLRWGMNDFERPWKVENPGQLKMLVNLLQQLNDGRPLRVGLEPTGTYGDALRQALSDARLETHRVSPKASHDYAEVFDGAPSKHDGKDAAVVAELVALGKSAPWPFEVSEFAQELAFHVDWIEAQNKQATMWSGRLEGLLARHWPEACETLSLRNGTLLRCLQHYGGPAALTADEEAKLRLSKWSRGRLSAEKQERLLEQAGESLGVRQSGIDLQRVRQYAGEVLKCREEITARKRLLKELTADHEVLVGQAKAVGVATACVLWKYLGDPRQYECGAAYRKAMGLNLTERSSGQYVGQLKISKRGHSPVRRWLYFAALRLLRREEVKTWCEAKKARRAGDGTEAMRAVVGVMRKLALALYRVAVDEVEFDPAKLFPGSGRKSDRAA